MVREDEDAFVGGWELQWWETGSAGDKAHSDVLIECRVTMQIRSLHRYRHQAPCCAHCQGESATRRLGPSSDNAVRRWLNCLTSP